MPNIANIDRLISYLKKDKGIHFSMKTWKDYLDNTDLDGRTPNGIRRTVTKYETCNTAFCLGGWIAWTEAADLARASNPAVKLEDIPMPVLNDEEYTQRGADWLGIEYIDAWRLFFNTPYNHVIFDGYPHQMRANAAIRVLELLKIDGTAQWRQALKDVGMTANVDDYLQTYEAPKPSNNTPPSLVA